MKKLLSLLMFSIFLNSYGQNLVPNGDFEIYSALPNSVSDWSYCVGWNNVNLSMSAWPYATPDYFHTAGTGDGQLPNCKFASVNPQSGDAIFGLYSRHSSQLNSRDYISTQLSSPLVVGNTYTISFWLTSGYGNYYYGSSSSNFGVQLSTSPFTQANHENIGGTPQALVTTDPWLTGWVFYSFTYVATAAHQYITIGNFHTDAATTTTVHDGSANYPTGSYYFVDDVVVEGASPLPVQLVDLDAQNQESSVVLTWQTESELNNDYFTIERSADAKTWSAISTVDGAGTSMHRIEYNYVDKTPLNGISYYRLRQTDFDGKISHTSTRAVFRKSAQDNELHLYPNPSNDFIIVEATAQELLELHIYNALGEDVTQKTSRTALRDDVIRIELNSLAQGTYLIKTATHTERFIRL